jgi:DNA-binding CsgD family transcriptional regulator
MNSSARLAPNLGEFHRLSKSDVLAAGQGDIWPCERPDSMSPLFRVSRDREIEAETATKAAFLYYKMQKEESTSTASYSVQSDYETLVDVTIAQIAPLELLTLREREVARLVMQGASNADIGKELAITTRTVKAHVSHIFEKFHVTKRVNLATKMLRMQRSDADVDV